VVATTGVHEVDIQYCGCFNETGASHPRLQLLRSALLPSTVDRPSTAFTFNVLNTFHLLTLQGKTSAFDFYLAIAHKTDNLGLENQKVSYSFYLLAM
jgi:CxC2 like cysteine cluster associated with KDZ transposases